MSRPIGDLSFEGFTRILEAIPSLRYVSLFFMGEPFLNDDLLRMVSYAERNGIKTHIATNSTLLRNRAEEILDSGLSSIALSLDGLSQESVEQYRVNCDFSSMIEGIESLCRERLRRRKANLEITIRFLVFHHNQHEIPDIMAFAQKMQVRLHLVRPILDWGFERPPRSRMRFLSSIREFQRYNTDGSLRKPRACNIFGTLITWDGRILPCCYDTDACYEVGNVFEQDFYRVYWGARFRDLRRKMHAKALSICSACKRVSEAYTEINWRRDDKPMAFAQENRLRATTEKAGPQA